MGIYFLDSVLKYSPLIGPIVSIGIARFVYVKWHEQKAKEVLANEARQCIKDLLEMIKIINFLKERKYDLAEHEKEFAKFKSLFEQSIINIMYLKDCVEIGNLGKQLNKFTEPGNLIIKLKTNNSWDYDEPNFLENLNYNIFLFSDAAIILVNTLKPYSIYIKEFKLKVK